MDNPYRGNTVNRIIFDCVFSKTEFSLEKLYNLDFEKLISDVNDIVQESRLIFSDGSLTDRFCEYADSKDQAIFICAKKQIDNFILNMHNRCGYIKVGKKFIIPEINYKLNIGGNSGKRIWVIIPTYERSDFLRIALNSICESFSKMNHEWGIVICNDFGDADSVNQICDEFNLENIECIHHQENKGVGAARKTATDKALEYSPDYILSIDDDSKVGPKAIEIAVSFMNSNDDVGIIGTDNKSFSLNKPDFYEKNAVAANFALIRVSALNKIGCHWDENLRYREDQDLSVNIKREGYRLFGSKKINLYHQRRQPGGLLLAGDDDAETTTDYLVKKHPDILSKRKNRGLNANF